MLPLGTTALHGRDHVSITLRRFRGSGLLIADFGPIGIVIHQLSDMTEMGWRYVPGTRGEWVRGTTTRP